MMANGLIPPAKPSEKSEKPEEGIHLEPETEKEACTNA